MRKFLAAASGAIVLVEAKQNPIRRVVTLLQEMASEIEAEVAKEKDQFEKFECFCKKNDGELDAKAKEAAALIKKKRGEVDGLTGQKKALAEDLKKHKKDREKAKKNLDASTEKRMEEKSKYDAATKEQRKTLEDIDSAIVALEKGMGKSFLQTSAADYLKNVIDQNSAALSNLDVSDQESVVAFLQNKKDYAPVGGEIVGILKTMKDNFDESLGGIIKEEEDAAGAYKKLKVSLTELIQASGAAIEKKTELKGQVAVKIVEAKNVIATTEKQMGDDMATLAELKEACGAKSNEFYTRQKDAAGEVEAINQAIGVLDNDDALQLFNKADPKALVQTSLLQLKKNDPRKLALEQLNSLPQNNKAIAMLAFTVKQALKSRAGVDFSKIIKMIDDMVVLLKKEMDDDLHTRDQCNVDFNDAAADKKETEHAVNQLSATIEELGQVIEAQAGIMQKNADDVETSKASMAEATKQREADNAGFVEAVDLNKEAVALIQKAKNKLNTYYNPQLVPAEKAPELSPEEELEAGARTVLIQKHAFTQTDSEKLPEGQPEIFSGARKNKGAKGSSVLALMDMLAGDINKDTAALQQDEAVAQSDYEKLSQDLANQVAESTKAGNEASATKAKAEEDKQTAESTLSMKEEELDDVRQTIADLHAQCDFILKAFEERKGARENEISGLDKAKAILSGANFE